MSKQVNKTTKLQKNLKVKDIFISFINQQMNKEPEEQNYKKKKTTYTFLFLEMLKEKHQILGYFCKTTKLLEKVAVHIIFYVWNSSKTTKLHKKCNIYI